MSTFAKPRRQRPEEVFQRSVCQFLDRALPEGCVYFSVPNGHVSRLQRMRLAAMGTVSGSPDLVVVYKGKFIGLELKSAKGVLSPAQKEMHMRIKLAGGIVYVAKTLSQVDGFLSLVIPLRAHVT
jgi:hypothetical protein